MSVKSKTKKGRGGEVTVCVPGNDIVQFVRKTARSGDIGDASGPVKLGGQDVVEHTTSVTNPEASRLDTTNSSRADDGHGTTILLVPCGSQVNQLASVTLCCYLFPKIGNVRTRTMANIKRKSSYLAHPQQ